MYAGYKVIGPVLSPKGLSSFPIGDSYATPGNDLSLSLPPPPLPSSYLNLPPWGP